MKHTKNLLDNVTYYVMNEKIDTDKMNLILDLFKNDDYFTSLITSPEFKKSSVNNNSDIQNLIYNKTEYSHLIKYMDFDTYVNLEVPNYRLIKTLLCNSLDPEFYTCEYFEKLINKDIQYLLGIIDGLYKPSVGQKFKSYIPKILTPNNIFNLLKCLNKNNKDRYFQMCIDICGVNFFKQLVKSNENNSDSIDYLINYLRDTNKIESVLKPMQPDVVVGLVEFLFNLDSKFFNNDGDAKFSLLINIINLTTNVPAEDFEPIFLKIINTWDLDQYYFSFMKKGNIDKLVRLTTIHKNVINNKIYSFFKKLKNVCSEDLKTIFNLHDIDDVPYSILIPPKSKLTDKMIIKIAENEYTFFIKNNDDYYNSLKYINKYKAVLEKENKNIFDEFNRINSDIFKSDREFTDFLISNFKEDLSKSKIFKEHFEYFLYSPEMFSSDENSDLYIKLLNYILENDKLIYFNNGEVKITDEKISELDEMFQYLYYYKLLSEFRNNEVIDVILKCPILQHNKYIKKLVLELTLKE